MTYKYIPHYLNWQINIKRAIIINKMPNYFLINQLQLACLSHYNTMDAIIARDSERSSTLQDLWQIILIDGIRCMQKEQTVNVQLLAAALVNSIIVAKIGQVNVKRMIRYFWIFLFNWNRINSMRMMLKNSFIMLNRQYSSFRYSFEEGLLLIIRLITHTTQCLDKCQPLKESTYLDVLGQKMYIQIRDYQQIDSIADNIIFIIQCLAQLIGQQYSEITTMQSFIGTIGKFVMVITMMYLNKLMKISTKTVLNMVEMMVVVLTRIQKCWVHIKEAKQLVELLVEQFNIKDSFFNTIYQLQTSTNACFCCFNSSIDQQSKNQLFQLKYKSSLLQLKLANLLDLQNMFIPTSTQHHIPIVNQLITTNICYTNKIRHKHYHPSSIQQQFNANLIQIYAKIVVREGIQTQSGPRIFRTLLLPLLCFSQIQKQLIGQGDQHYLAVISDCCQKKTLSHPKSQAADLLQLMGGNSTAFLKQVIQLILFSLMKNLDIYLDTWYYYNKYQRLAITIPISDCLFLLSILFPLIRSNKYLINNLNLLFSIPNIQKLSQFQFCMFLHLLNYSFLQIYRQRLHEGQAIILQSIIIVESKLITNNVLQLVDSVCHILFSWKIFQHVNDCLFQHYHQDQFDTVRWSIFGKIVDHHLNRFQDWQLAMLLRQIKNQMERGCQLIAKNRTSDTTRLKHCIDIIRGIANKHLSVLDSDKFKIYIIELGYYSFRQFDDNEMKDQLIIIVFLTLKRSQLIQQIQFQVLGKLLHNLMKDESVQLLFQLNQLILSRQQQKTMLANLLTSHLVPLFTTLNQQSQLQYIRSFLFLIQNIMHLLPYLITQNTYQLIANWCQSSLQYTSPNYQLIRSRIINTYLVCGTSYIISFSIHDIYDECMLNTFEGRELQIVMNLLPAMMRSYHYMCSQKFNRLYFTIYNVVKQLQKWRKQEQFRFRLAMKVEEDYQKLAIQINREIVMNQKAYEMMMGSNALPDYIHQFFQQLQHNQGNRSPNINAKLQSKGEKQKNNKQYNSIRSSHQKFNLNRK